MQAFKDRKRTLPHYVKVSLRTSIKDDAATPQPRLPRNGSLDLLTQQQEANKEAREKYNKQNSYARQVQEMYQPKVSQAKRLEMEQLRQKVDSINKPKIKVLESVPDYLADKQWVEKVVDRNQTSKRSNSSDLDQPREKGYFGDNDPEKIANHKKVSNFLTEARMKRE